MHTPHYAPHFLYFHERVPRPLPITPEVRFASWSPGAVPVVDDKLVLVAYNRNNPVALIRLMRIATCFAPRGHAISWYYLLTDISCARKHSVWKFGSLGAITHIASRCHSRETITEPPQHQVFTGQDWHTAREQINPKASPNRFSIREPSVCHSEFPDLLFHSYDQFARIAESSPLIIERYLARWRAPALAYLWTKCSLASPVQIEAWSSSCMASVRHKIPTTTLIDKLLHQSNMQAISSGPLKAGDALGFISTFF